MKVKVIVGIFQDVDVAVLPLMLASLALLNRCLVKQLLSSHSPFLRSYSSLIA